MPRSRSVGLTLTATAPAPPAPATSFADLYRATFADVYAYVATIVLDRSAAEDVTAQAYERALRKRRSFDARRGSERAWRPTRTEPESAPLTVKLCQICSEREKYWTRKRIHIDSLRRPEPGIEARMPRAFGLRSVSQTFTVAHRCLDFRGSAADAGAAATRRSRQAQRGRSTRGRVPV